MGYQCLSQGEFSNSIEFFPRPKHLPLDLNMEEFDELRKSFKIWRK